MFSVDHVSIEAGGFKLDDVSFAVDPDAYCVIIGPPGSGKTTLMEGLCGLRQVRQGRICLNDRDITDLPPGQRNIGYMPQDYALFPHLSVRDNIAFGLTVRHTSKPEIMRQVTRISALLGIPHLLGRSPVSLSGGEKQKVALARALAISPRLLLLDEPLSALDQNTKTGILRDLKSFHQQVRIPVLHICHDFEEMKALADYVLVLWNGRLVLQGTLDQIRRASIDETLALFLGFRSL